MMGSESVRKQSLLQGAFVLTAAGLITKILGFATTILQSRIIGAEAIGLQMMVTPLIGLLMTITTLGLPVAVSKAVAEAEAQGNKTKIKRILLVSLTLTCSAALILTLGLAYFGKTLSRIFLADQRAYYSLMAIVPVIPILAISGILRGYFQGRQNMNPLALSQVIEQIIRIALLYGLVQAFAERGIEYAAAGAVLAGVLGELAALIYLLFKFRTVGRYRSDSLKLLRGLTYSKIDLVELLRTGLPQTGNQFFRSLLRVVQPTLITRSLLKTGLSASAIAEQFGMLTGYVYPLLFFPGFINYSLAVALVPAISEAASRNRMRLANRRASNAFRASLLVGVPSSLILFVFAEPILTLFYRTPEAAGLLRVTAPFYLFQYFHSPMQSSLIGLGRSTTAMVNNIVPRCIGLALIYPLAVTMGWGIYGVAAASNLAVVLETVLHYLALRHRIGPCFQFAEAGKIIAIGAAAACFSKFTYDTIIMYQVSKSTAAVWSAAVLLLIYFALIFITNTLRWSAVWVTFKRR